MRAHQLITRSDTLIMNSLLRQERWRRNAADRFEHAAQRRPTPCHKRRFQHNGG